MERRKRHIYKGEEIQDANDGIKGNPEELTQEERWFMKKIRNKKKRIKYREKVKKKKKLIEEHSRRERDGCQMPIALEEEKENGKLQENYLSKSSIKKAASTLFGPPVASDEFQRKSSWKRNEKDLKNSNRTTGEKGRKLEKLEEIYSFKTMLRVLYQAGIIMLKEIEDKIRIPEICFPVSWVGFAGQVEGHVEE
jgi:hypothetical protein